MHIHWMPPPGGKVSYLGLLSGGTAKMRSMTQVSTARKLSAAGRVALQQAGHSRLLRGVLAGGRAALGSFSRVLHLLFLEVTGFFFLVFAVIGSYAFMREYRAWAAGKIGPGKTVVALAFTVMFAWFGLSSFWRARKK